MYIPSSFREEDLPTLHAFLEAHPLAALVTAVGGASDLFATHLPLILDREAGPLGTLRGHVARANPHARQLKAGPAPGLVVFTGPDAYITPNWYPLKREHGRVVPTWNYVAVHASGTVTPREDPEFLLSHLEALTEKHEAARAGGWKVSDAPEEYIAQLMRAIVGLEIRIDRLEGKWKMSQNRSAADIDGVIAGLSESASATDRAVAGIVAERRPGRGH
ncbi:MAG TPA: FMN-binding negative transcriptional regulator [Longimicrobiales bacterium]|nr:FMN-binding negative transcriptional regulator [Longimicrobiales bacterium]